MDTQCDARDTRILEPAPRARGWRNGSDTLETIRLAVRPRFQNLREETPYERPGSSVISATQVGHVHERLNHTDHSRPAGLAPTLPVFYPFRIGLIVLYFSSLLHSRDTIE